MDLSRARPPTPPAAASASVLAVLTVLAVSGLVTVSGCSAGGAPAVRDGATTTRAAVPRAANQLEEDYRKAVDDVLPSVVQIQADDSLGSGVVYDGKGHIVTNAHVVGDARTFRVTTANSGDVVSARLVYAYPEQDLAVIRLNEVPKGLRAASFGDSSKVGVGQIVLAMGSPLGLSSSVTQGIVSATGRTVTEGGAGGGTGATIPNMVQTSAAINPGNSGGALVNLASQVVGIPTLGATDPNLGEGAAPGIGFAIPSSMVRTVADQIIRSGRVTDSGRAALGITGRTLVGGDYRPAGVAVVTVDRGGPADRAGIEGGDVITGLAGTDVTTMTSLAEALAERRPGDRTSITYLRDDDERTARVTLGEQ
ncbi:protease [Streptomyces ruber]|uniref:Protease n=2 Tax=Streptomyces TaxID=1883 RepID=A0A918BFZ7_9ACTN|nr:trypsin-like peptidase domain-containing protein [Streptomyces ruber]GGQ66519.1 protease [Streptomyces ruber]